MMAFHRRKLLDVSIPDLCQSLCPEPQTTCPPTCYKYCPDSCKLSVSFQFPPPPPPPPTSAAANPGGAQSGGLSHALTISLAVLATAFFLFTCYTIHKFYTLWKASRRRRMRQSQRRDLDEEGGDGGNGDFIDEDVVDHPIWYIRTVGLQPSVINAITIVKYKSGDGIVEGTDCAVCLSEFEEDETVRLLPKCSHAFHIPCIDTWLASHTNCPLCRAGIVAATGGTIQPQEEPISVDSRRIDEGSEGLGLSEIEGDGAVRSQIGIELGGNVEGDCKIDVELDAAMQPVRRSVSMDALSASALSAAVANAFPRQCDKSSGYQLGKFESPSIERCAQTGSSSIKRSASCSAKVFLSRHSSRR